jgi:hypothetical protein
VLEGYYNRYEQERQNRASQITETDSDFDLGAVARDLPSMFGYASSMDLGGIDPVTIQAGLRGDYAVRPPDDYMPGFEAEYSYFQDDPYAQKNPYRGYRPTTGGIESEGPYFDPILDRQSYKNKLKEYYKTLASYGMGTGPDDPDDDDVSTPGQPDDNQGYTPLFLKRIDELMSQGMTREAPQIQSTLGGSGQEAPERPMVSGLRPIAVRCCPEQVFLKLRAPRSLRAHQKGLVLRPKPMTPREVIRRQMEESI